MVANTTFSGCVGIVQRVLAAYRIPFFDALAARCSGGLQVFAGQWCSNQYAKEVGTLLVVAEHRNARNICIGRGRFFFCWQQGVGRWIRSYRPDVLVVEANPRIISVYPLVFLARRRGIPVIGWGLGVLNWDSPDWVMGLRDRFLGVYYRLFDAMISYSSKGAQDYRKRGVPEKRLFVAHNVVSGEDAKTLREEIGKDPTLLQQWKEQHGLLDKPIVLFVGRLQARKRVVDLIEACKPLNSMCHLVIVGDGPESERLKAYAASHLPDTKFLGDRRGREVALCFAAADLFVLPGTGGLALHEAMTYGNPVLVSRGDGTERDLVRSGVNGFLFPVGEVEKLTGYIHLYLSDKDLRERHGKLSRQIVEEQYNLDNMVDAFLDAIESVMVRSS